MDCIGFSTGSLIASDLSVQYQDRIKSLTLLSTPVFPLNLLEIARTLGSPVMIRNYLSKFGTTPAKATKEFLRLVRESFNIYPQIKIPTLIVQGRRNHLVRAKSAAYLQRRIPSGGKRVLMVERSGHMLCHGEHSGQMSGGGKEMDMDNGSMEHQDNKEIHPSPEPSSETEFDSKPNPEVEQPLPSSPVDEHTHDSNS
ncbi:hypothetical protein AMQ83_31720 [Paenibacillus riograndensis]|nr:hypothetical protein AMQ83_31720 [Paenibacillus riograndensis]